MVDAKRRAMGTSRVNQAPTGSTGAALPNDRIGGRASRQRARHHRTAVVYYTMARASMWTVMAAPHSAIRAPNTGALAPRFGGGISRIALSSGMTECASKQAEWPMQFRGLNTLSATSLVFFLAVLAVWARSRWYCDAVSMNQVHADRLQIAIWSLGSQPMSFDGGFVRITGPDRAQFDQYVQRYCRQRVRFDTTASGRHPVVSGRSLDSGPAGPEGMTRLGCTSGVPPQSFRSDDGRSRGAGVGGADAGYAPVSVRVAGTTSAC